MLDHFSNNVSLSDLSPAELDMIAGAGLTTTVTVKCAVDANGDGSCTVTETVKDD